MKKLLFILTTTLALLAGAAQREGCHVEEVYDEDGDMQILMESEWISMYIMPSLQSTIVRFVFRPTGNDILSVVQPKYIMGGGGLLQDNFWGQDWRYSEFRGRFYNFQIVKDTPEEVAVAFETVSEGWVRATNSGLRSKLWSNIRLRRTVRLRSNAPYFLFDLELINEDKNSKLPLMWVHNTSLCDPVQGDFVFRPSKRGVQSIGQLGEIGWMEGEHYIYDFNEGWSARIAPARKEGIVYLMDYDYINFLYNNGTNTAEWVYDNVLITPDRPWHGRTYILPTVGLEKVDFAIEHFIVATHLQREEGRLELLYRVTASYEPVKRITFNTDLEYGHYRGEGIPDDPQVRKLDPVSVEGLGIAPVEARLVVDDPPQDPLLLTIKAHMEMPDGTLKTRRFQVFYVGEYEFGRNVRQDMSTPVVELDRPVQKPWVPVPTAGLTVNRKDWKVFALLGPYSRVHHLRRILRSHPGTELAEEADIGYTPGFMSGTLALSDYPYDYQRLYDYRVMVWANSRIDVARMVGASVLANYLANGGGLLMFGGDLAFTMEYADPPNPLNDFIPIQPRPDNLRRGAHQLDVKAPDHPIFKGVDLTKLPTAFWTHDVQTKPDSKAQVLVTAGGHPWLVVAERDGCRTVVLLAAPFGTADQFAGKTPYWEWSEWPKLVHNALRYAGHDL